MYPAGWRISRRISRHSGTLRSGTRWCPHIVECSKNTCIQTGRRAAWSNTRSHLLYSRNTDASWVGSCVGSRSTRLYLGRCRWRPVCSRGYRAVSTRRQRIRWCWRICGSTFANIREFVLIIEGRDINYCKIIVDKEHAICDSFDNWRRAPVRTLRTIVPA